jgi:hypothetical protein
MEGYVDNRLSTGRERGEGSIEIHVFFIGLLGLYMTSFLAG